jgi:hypothetical protein
MKWAEGGKIFRESPIAGIVAEFGCDRPYPKDLYDLVRTRGTVGRGPRLHHQGRYRHGRQRRVALAHDGDPRARRGSRAPQLCVHHRGGRRKLLRRGREVPAHSAVKYKIEKSILIWFFFFF